MARQVEVTILVDNTSDVPELATEHGLSMWVNIDEKHILFDTGMGVALAENVVMLGIDLRETSAIVLSHGHFDHTGGLLHIFEQGISSPIFMHPDAVGMRFGCLQAPPLIPIGMRPDIAQSLSEKTSDIVGTTGPVQVTDHTWVTGPIPRHTSFEDTGGLFFVDVDGLSKDAIKDDQAIWLETAEGIVVLLGCAHSGVVNTLDYIAALTGTKQFHAIIGGMHLLNASAERLEATVDAMRRYQVKLIAPCHCTGDFVMPILAQRFPNQCVGAGAGSRFTWLACG
jgi:7,8-dihydropterin-6-yl-methyl-4-(beta-D-ribofuranosyl)aminobenzene 5'-phosphate synthase